MLEALQKQLEETKEKLIKAEEQCVSLEEERLALEGQLAEANKYIETYNTGKELGNTLMAMMSGLEASGMPKDMAQDMTKLFTANAIKATAFPMFPFF